MIVDRVRGAARGAWGIGVETYEHWRDHRTIRLGAGLAYYGLFAIVPLLALALSVAGLVVSRADVQSYFTDQLSALLGVDADDVALTLATALDGTGTIAGLGLIGAASLFLTASVLVVAVQDAFNTIWERPVRSGIRQTVIRRLVAFVVVIGAGAVIIVSFVLNAIAGVLGRVMPDVAFVEPLEELFGAATSWALLVAVIALLFRYLTDIRVPWLSVLVGAALTAVMLAAGTALVGAYLQRYAASSLVAVTGSVFLLLLWIYYVGQIVLVGVEFTRVLALRAMEWTPAAAGGSACRDGEAGATPRDDAAVDVDR